jgi:formylglycine-generating enzyme required for sulfatase activity
VFARYWQPKKILLAFSISPLCKAVMKSPTTLGFRIFSCFAAIAIFSCARAQTSLQAGLTPTVIINGPLGSLQQVQYSTNVADPTSWTALTAVRVDAPVKYFFDTSGSGQQRFYRTMLMGVADTNLVWIPPGTFLMGSPSNEVLRSAAEGPQTPVTLTQGFLTGRFEVRVPELVAYLPIIPTRQTTPATCGTRLRM